MRLKRMIICLFLLTFLQSNLFSQLEWQSNYDADSSSFLGKTIYQSWVGHLVQLTDLGYTPAVAPNGTLRGLCIYINIIYDQTPSLDPCTYPNDVWSAATIEGVNNQAIPGFLDDFIDVDYDPSGSTGIMTRLYDESSFGNLIVLGDHMIVNIKQSTITPSSPGASFSDYTLIP